MRIRIQGLPDEAEAAAKLIGRVTDVITSSGQRPLRGNSKEVFIYLEVRIGPSDGSKTEATIQLLREQHRANGGCTAECTNGASDVSFWHDMLTDAEKQGR